jgi:hypothetical protein
MFTGSDTEKVFIDFPPKLNFERTFFFQKPLNYQSYFRSSSKRLFCKTFLQQSSVRISNYFHLELYGKTAELVSL